MPLPMGLVQLHFRPGSDFMNPESPVGSCFKQFLLNITATPPFAIRSAGGAYMFAGPQLDDPDKAVVLICYDTGTLAEARAALHTTTSAAVYAPLAPHLAAAPCADAFLFVKPPTPNFGQYRARVNELALLRLPGRRFDDVDDEIADDESPFAAGLWHLEDFFNDAQSSGGHSGPADLARHYQGVSPPPDEGEEGGADGAAPTTSVLHTWSWASETAMRRFKDPARANCYDHLELAHDPDAEYTGDGKPDDLWQTGFLKEIDELREKGAEVSVVAFKLQQFSLITKKLGYID